MEPCLEKRHFLKTSMVYAQFFAFVTTSLLYDFRETL
jgi:hypothetical protein